MSLSKAESHSGPLMSSHYGLLRPPLQPEEMRRERRDVDH